MPTKPPSIKALIRNLGKYLDKVWSHLQYYRYEPSKPSKAAFLKLTLAEQEAWIEANVPDYEDKLYGENYLGCSYQIDEATLAEYLEYREDYDVSGIIETQLSNLTEERLVEIDDGAILTREELEALKLGIAEDDTDSWQTHSGQYIKVRFGAVYALYAGEGIGQGGSSFEIEGVFANKKLALHHVSDKPMAAIE